MSADRDPRDQESEDEVEDDETHRLPSEDVDLSGLEQHGRAHEAPDRSRGADGESVRAQDERSGGACKPRDQVQEQIAPAAEVLLERRADEPQHEHVQSQVYGAVVEERCRDQPPPVALGDADSVTGRVDRGRDEHAVLVDPAGVGVDPGTCRELEQVDADVDADEDPRDEPDRGAQTPGGDLRALLGRGGGAFRMIRTADAYRPEDHAVRADSAAALRAGDVGLAVRMAIATKRFGHGLSSS